MKILIGCEESGVVREAFRKLGHDAWSCDVLPTRIPGQHIQADVLSILDGGWDMAIFHPPCTYLSNSGVRWLYEKDGSKNKERWREMKTASIFFKKLLDADIPRIAVENPVIHKYAMKIIGRRYDQKVQPYWFGHGETKGTCFWLKNLPHLVPTKIVNERRPRIANMSPSPTRQRDRSVTYQGIADAIALQWGSINP